SAAPSATTPTRRRSSTPPPTASGTSPPAVQPPRSAAHCSHPAGLRTQRPTPPPIPPARQLPTPAARDDQEQRHRRPAHRGRRIAAGRDPEPTTAIIDSQSVKAAETVGKPGRPGPRRSQAVAVEPAESIPLGQ